MPTSPADSSPPAAAASPADRASRRLPLLLAFLLLAATTLAFINVPRCDFVTLDDPYYVTENIHVQQGLTLQNLRWAFTDFNAYWIPLTWLSLMLDFQFGGLSPVPFHVTNLLFHLANTLLLFAFLRRATGDLWRPALAAALFALHPLRVESVAWVTERKDVLSAFFALLALFVYVGDGFGHVVGGRDKHWPRLALVGLLMVLSLWAKPMLITLPCVLLLLDAWPLRRAGLPTSAPDGWTFGEPNPPWWAWRWRPYLEKLPLLAVSLAFAVVALLTQTNTGAVRTDGTYTPAARLANALVSYCRYLGKHFWFGNLAVPYPYPPAWPATIVIGAAALLLAITLAALLLYRPRPFLAVGWFWFLGTLLPVIGVIQSGDQSMADRFTYFPSIGLCIAAAWLLPNRLGATALARRVTAAAAATVLVALAVFTYRQVDHWRNSEALFTRAVTVTAGNCFAHDALAKVLDGKGDHAGAFKHFRESININPNFFDPHFNLGVALMRANNHREAAEQFDIASQLRPTSVDAHGNFGLALANLNQFDRAIRQYQQAISLSPPGAASPRLHGNLANALLLRGDPARAIEHYRIALAAQPDNADLRGRLGLALASIGRFDDALRELATALAKKPDDPVLRQMLDRVREAKRQSGGP